MACRTWGAQVQSVLTTIVRSLGSSVVSSGVSVVRVTVVSLVSGCQSCSGRRCHVLVVAVSMRMMKLVIVMHRRRLHHRCCLMMTARASIVHHCVSVTVRLLKIHLDEYFTT